MLGRHGAMLLAMEMAELPQARCVEPALCPEHESMTVTIWHCGMAVPARILTRLWA